MLHFSALTGGLACVVICDSEYPSRVAFALADAVLSAFAEWPGAQAALRAAQPEGGAAVDGTAKEFAFIPEALAKYQDPAQADSITRVQRDLDETKGVMVKTIEQLLERGEKLDTLVDKCNDMSLQSKTFYKTAKKTNSRCCVLQ
eukprot:TRINITY_DN5965_c0_g2_i3.p3 TRINITY_DN5965_c0_g2~~TRINITY_DN5965_c0_g2_i3.p3  ORF type:complete len:145 (-),score=64.76 TRINITY_DN5965_c0_g2_i3:15-449(-)